MNATVMERWVEKLELSRQMFAVHGVYYLPTIPKEKLLGSISGARYASILSTYITFDALLTHMLAYPSLNRAPRFSISHADGQNVKWDPRVSFMEGQKRKGMEICEQEEDEEVIFVDIQGNNAGNLTYTYS